MKTTEYVVVTTRKRSSRPEQQSNSKSPEIDYSTLGWRDFVGIALGAALWSGFTGHSIEHSVEQGTQIYLRLDALRRAYAAPDRTTEPVVDPTPPRFVEEESYDAKPDDAESEEATPDEAEADGAKETDVSETPVDSAIAQAAALLGVEHDAGQDQIRAALRSRLGSSRLHPDHGGDGEEAKRLIAAKNFLIERARAREGAQ